MDMQIPDPIQVAGQEPALAGKRAVGALARLRRAERSSERLRWGLTGLAAIFLIVMLAATRLGPARNAGQASAGEPGTGEPLAVLGVAPGPATRPPETR
jgi:hypothetical protein